MPRKKPGPPPPDTGRLTRSSQAAKRDPASGPEAQSEDDETTPISVIFYKEAFNTDGSTPDTIKEQAQALLCSGEENLEVGQIDDADTLTVGNREGLDYMTRTAETALGLQKCHAERASLTDRVSKLELEQKYLRERVRCLEAESASRSLSRMRFISTFKRDHMPDQFDVTFKDSETIRAGNREAHDPDPLADCDLYMNRRRRDDGAFSALYGLSPLTVDSLRQGFDSIIEALICYAEFKKNGETSATLEDIFHAFVALITLNDNDWIAAEVADAASNLRSLLRQIRNEHLVLLRARSALRAGRA